jgi:hypothetical protein
MLSDLPLDWFLLLLRLLFVLLLYFFLYQIARVTARELSALAVASAPPRPAESPTVGARFVVMDPGETTVDPGTIFPLQPLTVVGRRADCAIVIDDSFVSGEHAEVSHERGSWRIRDLNSTNGTLLNGTRLTIPADLRAGDVVQIGGVHLQFVS